MRFLLLYWRYIAAAAIVAALAIAYNVHVDHLIDAAVVKAVTERDSAWRKAEAEKIAESEASARATEAQHARAISELRDTYLKEIKDAKTQRDRDVANARSGALVLRYPASCPSAGNDSKAASATARSDGPATLELPPTLTGDLFALADDADATADQLRACQAVILSDRKETP